MNKERLQEILELKNARKIEYELIEKENYFDMEKSAELRKADFVPVF